MTETGQKTNPNIQPAGGEGGARMAPPGVSRGNNPVKSKEWSQPPTPSDTVP
jgi:hypothetical protein